MSALSDYRTALKPSVSVSKKSQKHKKATPRFQLFRMKFVRRTRKSIAAERKQATGYSGYVGSVATMMLS